ncbi:putative disease resistance RPP13-like protein 1 [Rhododendron vialii]|uniref:putative disease resistance RPP13-like protein 1 n=1 Tax=Rhododendron vialii TaxID=182163 RepID=UPI00265D7A1A|nr:putative disease resistance RPP13-like protein 1 [Rhododendron vialii]
MEELPQDFHNMVSLRHFYLEDNDQNRKLMPMKIGQLTSLRTLPFFVVGEKSGHRIEELGSLSKLRGRLHVYDLQQVKDKEEAEKAQILGKSDIQELQFHWEENLAEPDNNHGDVLEGLKPHQNVKGLILQNFGGRRWVFWMSRNARVLQKLVKIELRDCRLCEQVPALGHLPHLAIVRMDGLQNLKRIGPEFYGQDGWIIDNCSASEAATPRVFPALRELVLCNMPQLEEWSDVSSLPAFATSTIESFPCLQRLDIRNCPKLMTIPDAAFYLLMSLRELSIVKCMELTCLPDGVLQPSLEEIVLEDCPKLKTLDQSDETEALFNDYSNLHKLQIEDCPELMCLPDGLLQPALLELQLLFCPKLKKPNPDALRRLKLFFLGIMDCPNRESCWEEGLFCTTNLQQLSIDYFGEEYGYFPWPSTSTTASPPSSHLTSLEYLCLWGWAEVKSLPDQLELLPALILLAISNFSGLESLPECLGNLSSLKSLEIWSCPLLEKRCEKGIGEDWHKIAHIPKILIDGRKIQ